MNKGLFKPKVIYFGLYDSLGVRVAKLGLKFFLISFHILYIFFLIYFLL